uniref:SEC7 domain-containing protein n=1 Tax=Heterorhabditis bacteriophora TaxID=37862 RepID=A0A1I7WM38_HETBA
MDEQVSKNRSILLDDGITNAPGDNHVSRYYVGPFVMAGCVFFGQLSGMSMAVCGKTPLSDWRGVSSASRVYAANGYEISDDLQRRRVEFISFIIFSSKIFLLLHYTGDIVLEKRYGGRHRAHRSAIIIQRAFREYQLNRRWRQMTSPIQSNNSSKITLSLEGDWNSIVGYFTSFRHSFLKQSLMSPRLVQRRFPSHSNVGQDTVGVPVVWVPRATLSSSNPAHSNSLPRLEKHIVRDREDHDAENIRVQPQFYSEQERKRQYRIALNFFNKKPERGVQLLTSWGFVDDSPESLAKLLFGRRGLSKQMIGEFIGTLHSSFHSCVLKRYQLKYCGFVSCYCYLFSYGSIFCKRILVFYPAVLLQYLSLFFLGALLYNCLLTTVLAHYSLLSYLTNFSCLFMCLLFLLTNVFSFI